MSRRRRRDAQVPRRRCTRPIFHAQTTDKLLLVAEDGRVYTMAGDKLPGGRGFGEPVRLLIDLPAEVGIVKLMVVRPDMKMLVAASTAAASSPAARPPSPKPARASSWSICGRRQRRGRPQDRRRRRRRRGYRREPQDAGLSLVGTAGTGARAGRHPATLPGWRPCRCETLKLAEGLSWTLGGESGRVRTESDLTPWRAARGAAGRLPPQGFPETTGSRLSL